MLSFYKQTVKTLQQMTTFKKKKYSVFFLHWQFFSSNPNNILSMCYVSYVKVLKKRRKKKQVFFLRKSQKFRNTGTSSTIFSHATDTRGLRSEVRRYLVWRVSIIQLLLLMKFATQVNFPFLISVCWVCWYLYFLISWYFCYTYSQ